MRRLALIVLSAALAAAALLAPAAGAATPKPATPSSGGDLYLLQATGGSLGAKKLVLHGVQPRAVTFTDRPRRAGGTLPVAGLTSGWSRTFGAVPPNAALQVSGAPKDRDVALIELRHPRYDAATETLTFTVLRLDHTGDPALKEFDRRADGDAVKSFGPSSLFVDSGSEAPVWVTFKIHAAIGGPVGITFESGELTYLGNVSGIKAATVPGYTTIGRKLMIIGTEPGGGEIDATVTAQITPTAGQIKGLAQINEGGSVEVTVEGGTTRKVGNEHFELAIPEGS
ncbi:MAG TPA: hypothetical protein VGC32_13625 [Solirubrobacterales bacterium]